MRVLKHTKIMEPKWIEIVASDIDWDTDGENVDLPNEVIYDLDLNDLEIISKTELEEIYEIETADALSRDYGFCVNGYSFKINDTNNYLIK